MAPQAVHFKGASVKGKKRKETGASKLTFDGRKKKKGPEKRQNSREDLNSKVSVVAEEDLYLDPVVYIDLDLDLDLDGISDEEFTNHHECCIRPRPYMTFHDVHKILLSNDPELSAQAELRKLMASDPTRYLNLDGKVVDIMEERKPLKGMTEMARELKEQEEMAKEMELKEQEEMAEEMELKEHEEN